MSDFCVHKCTHRRTLKYTFGTFLSGRNPGFRVMYLTRRSGELGSGGRSAYGPGRRVVEYDPLIQMLVEEQLTDGGFELAIATSGEETVTLLKGAILNTARLSPTLIYMARWTWATERKSITMSNVPSRRAAFLLAQTRETLQGDRRARQRSRCRPWFR
jgi:hypothetical protein